MCKRVYAYIIPFAWNIKSFYLSTGSISYSSFEPMVMRLSVYILNGRNWYAFSRLKLLASTGMCFSKVFLLLYQTVTVMYRGGLFFESIHFVLSIKVFFYSKWKLELKKGMCANVFQFIYILALMKVILL